MVAALIVPGPSRLSAADGALQQIAHCVEVRQRSPEAAMQPVTMVLKPYVQIDAAARTVPSGDEINGAREAPIRRAGLWRTR